MVYKLPFFRMLDNLKSFENKDMVYRGNDFQFNKVLKKDTKTVYSAKISLKPIDQYFKFEAISLYRELNIIPHLNHPSISKFIWYCSEDFLSNRCPTIITDYQNFSLHQILKQRSFILDDTRKLIIIYGVASGMEYLHSHDILHCDLKPLNIYLDDRLFPKISGFTVSKEISKLPLNEKLFIKGTPAYIAPEIYLNKGNSKSSDVYSFSLFVYELLTNEKPFNNVKDLNELYEELTIKGTRPKITENIPLCYRVLIEKCWSEDPEKRPTFSEVLRELRSNSDFITNNVNEEEYRKYIEYVKNYKKSFDSERQIPYIDDIISGIDYKEFAIESKFKGLYETEFNDLTFYLKQIDISCFKRVKNSKVLRGGCSTIQFYANEKTGEKFIFKTVELKKLLKLFLIEVSISLHIEHPCVGKCIGFNITPKKKRKHYLCLL